jgi:hypothetical protein
MSNLRKNKLLIEISSSYLDIEQHMKNLPKDKQQEFASFVVNDFMNSVDMFNTQAIRQHALDECDNDLLNMVELYEGLISLISYSSNSGRNTIKNKIGGSTNVVEKAIRMGHRYEEVQRERALKNWKFMFSVGSIFAIVALGASFAPDLAIPAVSAVYEKTLETRDLVSRYTTISFKDPYAEDVAPILILNAALKQQSYDAVVDKEQLRSNPIFTGLKEREIKFKTIIDEIKRISMELQLNNDEALASLRTNNVFKDLEKYQAKLVADHKPLSDSLCHYSPLMTETCKKTIDNYNLIKPELEAINKLVEDVKNDETILDIFKFSRASESIKSVPIQTLLTNNEDFNSKVLKLQDESLEKYFEIPNLRKVKGELETILRKNIGQSSDLTNNIVKILYYRGMKKLFTAITDLAQTNILQVNIEMTSFLQNNEEYNVQRYGEAHKFYKDEMEQCAIKDDLYCKNLNNLKKSGAPDPHAIIENLERQNLPLPVNFVELMRPIIKNPAQNPIANVYYLNRIKTINDFNNNPSIKIVLMTALIGGLLTVNILSIAGRLLSIPQQLVELVTIPLETIVNGLKIAKGVTEIGLTAIQNKQRQQTLLANKPKNTTANTMRPSTTLLNTTIPPLANTTRPATATPRLQNTPATRRGGNRRRYSKKTRKH